MGSTGAAFAVLFVALSTVAVGFAAPEENSKFISVDALDSSNITSRAPRKLYGQPSGSGRVCPVRFDTVRNIGAVGRSCRDRPTPSPARCCGALKAVACPYVDLINDNAVNGCANDMFFQINVRGRLPPGLFSHLCVEGPIGLKC